MGLLWRDKGRLEANVPAIFCSAEEGKLREVLLPPELSDSHRKPNPKDSMEEEIKAEFKRYGFILEDEEEILQKCKMFFFVLILPIPPRGIDLE